MTDKELKKLNRGELLEMLLSLSRENDELKAKVAELEAKMSDRQLAIDNAGSLAEASLKINGVFETAQQAAEQYLENIRTLNDRQQAICDARDKESEEKARALIRDTRVKCETMEKVTSEKCSRMTTEARERVNRIIEDQKGLRAILDSLNDDRRRL